MFDRLHFKLRALGWCLIIIAMPAAITYINRQRNKVHHPVACFAVFVRHWVAVAKLSKIAESRGDIYRSPGSNFSPL